MVESGGVPLIEAASRLGLTPDALRKRVARGRVPGYKANNQWFVYLTDDGQSDSQATVKPDALTGRVDELRDEVQFLRERLSARDGEIEEMRRNHAREVQELHVLLQTAQQNEQRLLSAGASVEESKPSNVSPMSRPLQAPVAIRGESPVESPQTPQRGVQRDLGASERPRRSWWQRLLGGE